MNLSLHQNTLSLGADQTASSRDGPVTIIVTPISIFCNLMIEKLKMRDHSYLDVGAVFAHTDF
jgi:hypothetical protein